jgi:hypothetical protein
MIPNRGVLRIGRRLLIPTEAHDSFNAVSRNCAEVVADEFSLRYDFTSIRLSKDFHPQAFAPARHTTIWVTRYSP